MPLIAIVVGVLLIAVGFIGYFPAENPSLTALIAAVFGAVFIVFGLVALNESRRKHMMHAAAGLGLIGAIASGYRAVPALAKYFSGDESVNRLALAATTSMMVICIVFVLLCLRSFVAARRARGGV